MILQKNLKRRQLLLKITKILFWALVVNSLILILTAFVDLRMLFTSVLNFSQNITTNSDEPLPPPPPVGSSSNGGVVLLPIVAQTTQTEQVIVPEKPLEEKPKPDEPAQQNPPIPPAAQTPPVNKPAENTAENLPTNQLPVHPSATQQTKEIEQKPANAPDQSDKNFFSAVGEGFCESLLICILLIIEIILMVLLLIAAGILMLL